MKRLVPILALAACESSEVEPLDNPVPIVESIEPSSVPVGSPVAITILGLGFVEGTQARWNGEARPTTFVDDRELTVALSAADLLASETEIDVVTAAPGGGTSAAVTLQVLSPPPMLESLSPSSAPAIVTGELRIEAFGTGFVNGSVLRWDGAPLNTDFGSPTILSAWIPDYLLQAGGSVPVTVSNPLGAESEPIEFLVENPIPALDELVPAELPLGGGELEVLGTGFLDAAVVVAGTPLAPKEASPSRLVVDVPQSLAGDAGELSVWVENPAPGGGASNILQLTILPIAPTVDYVMPPQALTGGSSLALAIVGGGFEAGATLTWNGAPRTIDVLGPERIELTVLAEDLAAPDTVEIVITNPFDGAQVTALFPLVTASDLLVMEPWGFTGNLLTSRLDGSEPQSFSPGNAATRVDASPVAPFAVYQTYLDRIYEIDLNTGDSRRVTPVSMQLTIDNEASPRYSHDGAWIYFSASDTSNFVGIWRARTDGSSVEHVVGEPERWLHFPSPSRDGSRVVYSRGTQFNGGIGPLAVYDLESSTSTPLGVHGFTSRWSPLDSWIVYLTHSWDLRAIRPDGTGDFALVTDVEVGYSFDFSPDGSFLVATTQSGEPIRIAFPSGVVQVLPGLPTISSIAWFGP